MKINKSNLIGYIEAILSFMKLPPLTTDQRIAWLSINESEIDSHLSKFYLSINIDLETLNHIQNAYFKEDSPQANSPFKRNNLNITILISSVLVFCFFIGLAFWYRNLRINKLHQAEKVLEESSDVKSVSDVNGSEAITNKDIVERLLNAEDNRDMEVIMSCFSDNMVRYWDLSFPTKQNLMNRYYDVWSKVSYSSNDKYYIYKLSETEYEMVGTFQYYSKKSQQLKEVATHVKYIFDDYGKIVICYGMN